MIKARVYKSERQEFFLKRDDNKQFISAKAKGNLLKDAEVVVGDYVLVEDCDGEFLIHEVLERKNKISRVLIREKKTKVTASNVDYLIILSSASKPTYKQGLVDRYLVRAYQWDIRPIVIFNKMDQHKQDKAKFDIEFEINRYLYCGIPCFEISAIDQDYKPQFGGQSFDELIPLLKNKTSILLGQSGVGKSKTITALSGGKIELKSRDLAKVGKGAHTTTWSEIVETDDFSLIDSPGIRSYSLADIEKEELIFLFPDLLSLSRGCEFNNCEHNEKSKGCVFYSDTVRHDENYLFIKSRLDSYHRIMDEIKKIPEWQK